jgi:membrane-bound lytic murein transglycosylase D
VEKKLTELVEAIHRYDLAGLGAGDALAEPGFEKPLLEDIPQMTFPIDPKIKNKVIGEVRATVSQLPLQVNDAVLSYLHYFSSERGRKIVAFGLRRAGRYREMVRRILDEEGVPQELMCAAQAESGFQPRAVSRKKATGMWQFVRGRGREYGLTQTPYTDDRLDPEKATRAAARHLRDLYHRFGNWYLALAAYNAGPGVVERAVERTGYADFWELRRRNVLPKETANYVPIILAMTIMVKNLREYGLHTLEIDPPLESDMLEMTAPTHLLLVSDLSECPISQLRELNPALLKNVAPAGYLLHTPKGTAEALRCALEAVPENRRASWRAHRVGDGETLAVIAQRYRTSKASILAANQALASAPEAGDWLLIPAVAQEQKAVARPGATRRPVRKSASRKTAPVRRAAS